MGRLIVPVEVPPGHSYCHGCKAALPLDRFNIKKREGVPFPRCRPCLARQVADQRAAKRLTHLFLTDRAAWERESSVPVDAEFLQRAAHWRERQVATAREREGVEERRRRWLRTGVSK